MCIKLPTIKETDLTKDQYDIFNHMFIYCDVPIEWAYLVAKACYYEDIILDGYYYDIVYHGFTWGTTAEGFDFWEGVFDGFAAEHRAKAMMFCTR